MRAPSVAVVPVESYTADDIAALLATCAGWTFFETQDHAIISLLAATGMRLSECANITMEHLDQEQCVVGILGKGSGGGRWRVAPCPKVDLLRHARAATTWDDRALLSGLRRHRRQSKCAGRARPRARPPGPQPQR